MEILERKAAITGIGQSDVGRRLGRDPLALTLDACLAAIADAGLSRADIDGVATYPGAMNAAVEQRVTGSSRLPATLVAQSLKVMVASAAIMTTGTETAVLKSVVSSHRDRGRCGPASRSAPYRHG